MRTWKLSEPRDRKRARMDRQFNPALKKKDPNVLSGREVEVISMTSQGFSSQGVGTVLCIKRKTVDWHLSNIYFKLDVHNKVSAINKARLMEYIT